MSIKIDRAFLNRRDVLRTGVAASASLAAGGLLTPAISRAADRPAISHGLQSGDVTGSSGMVWARADRPARMMVEWSTTESFANSTRVQPLDLIGGTDFAGKLPLTGLPSDQEIFYKVEMLDLADFSTTGEAMTGRFRTAPKNRRDISFVWSGDTAGQGWGIDVDRGGMKTYRTMAGHTPDFFIHSGDTIYADGPITAEKEMPDGGIWKSVTIEEKAKVARDTERISRAI